MPLTEWFVFAVEPDGVPQLRRPARGRAVAPRGAAVVCRRGRRKPGCRPCASPTIWTTASKASGAGGQLVEVSLVGWPLVASGATIGVLIGLDTGRAHRLPAISHGFADAIARLLEPAAYTLATALRVARAEALSVTDDLTQLYNSRYLNEVLRKETKRAMRSGWPLSLLFIDLDGFKGINERHGHLLGSRALIEAADVVRAERARDRHRRPVRRRRVRHPAARDGCRGGPLGGAAPPGPLPALHVSGRCGTRQPHYRVDRGSDVARCGRYSRRPAAGGRRGDVPREDDRARTAFTSRARENAGAAVPTRNRRSVDASLALFALLERPGHRPRHGQHLRLRARERDRRQRALHRGHQQGDRAASRPWAGKPRKCSAGRPATSSPSSR